MDQIRQEIRDFENADPVEEIEGALDLVSSQLDVAIDKGIKVEGDVPFDLKEEVEFRWEGTVIELIEIMNYAMRTAHFFSEKSAAFEEMTFEKLWMGIMVQNPDILREFHKNTAFEELLDGIENEVSDGDGSEIGFQ